MLSVLPSTLLIRESWEIPYEFVKTGVTIAVTINRDNFLGLEILKAGDTFPILISALHSKKLKDKYSLYT